MFVETTIKPRSSRYRWSIDSFLFNQIVDLLKRISPCVIKRTSWKLVVSQFTTLTVSFKRTFWISGELWPTICGFDLGIRWSLAVWQARTALALKPSPFSDKNKNGPYPLDTLVLAKCFGKPLCVFYLLGALLPAKFCCAFPQPVPWDSFDCRSSQFNRF